MPGTPWTTPLNTPDGLSASFAGISFLIKDLIKGSGGRDLVENKIPYRDGSTFENMARKPYNCSFTAVFIGDTASEDAKDFFNLINADDDGDPAATPQVFIHPRWGNITGWIDSWDDELDCTQVDYVEIACTFKEDNGTLDILQENIISTENTTSSDLIYEISNANNLAGVL